MRSRHPAAARGPNNGDARSRICAEAARIMAEEGVNDFHLAKRRATQRLNLPEGKNLPGNHEVEAALRDYLALFHGRRLAADTRRLRALALEAMRFFARHDPRLVGAVLAGTVTAASEIQLHLTADTPEEIGLLLTEHAIPYEQAERRLRFGGEREQRLPAFRFIADEVPVEACVFTRAAAREAPLSPVDGRPMHRANLKEVEALLAAPPGQDNPERI
jgi:hypothetical protein